MIGTKITALRVPKYDILKSRFSLIIAVCTGQYTQIGNIYTLWLPRWLKDR